MNTEPKTETSPAPQSIDTRARIGVEEVEYHILSPRSSSGALLRRAYELWRNVWRQTLQEVAGGGQLDSDEFVRQDEVGVLVGGGKLLSVTGLRWVDLSLPMAREDSYFRRWPESALAALGSGRVGISSNTLVAPQWRRARLLPVQRDSQHPLDRPVAIAAATICLTSARFGESEVGRFIGVSRNDRGMNRVLNLLPGVKLGQIGVHGIDSDVLAFDRVDPRSLGSVVMNLWDRRQRHY